MCGIAGIIRFAPAADPLPPQRAIPEPWLDTLEDAIRHRGPDGRGRFRERATAPDGHLIDIALVHRRLSIIDHGGGGQPMVSATPDGTIAVAFNGCIYNHRGLRADLQALGHPFASDHSDTEVLVHGTRAWGPALPDRLDGMYAYAAWDSTSARLLLARDPAGEKPLYIARIDPPGAGSATTLAFCSTVAGLLALQRQTGRGIHVDADGQVMWLKHGYWPRLPVALHEARPGACYILDSRLHSTDPLGTGDLRPSALRALRTPGRDATLEPERVETALAAAVASRLEADVPIGCFLSGGVDSSLVAAFAQRELRQRGRTLRTFTVRMPGRRGDETPYAAMVAQHLGTDHAVLDCSPGAAADLVRLLEQLGLPFGDSSLLPTHWVSIAARAHATVALGGDGGDELFAGYDRYRANAVLHAARPWLGWCRHLPASLVRAVSGKAGRVLASLRYHGYDDIATVFRTPELAALIGPRSAADALARQYTSRAVGADARQDDFDLYLPQDLMRKVDTAAMAVALEVRAPFLAREMVDLALSAPLAAVEADGAHRRRKGLLRAIARRLVPAPAIDRRKVGFGAPIGRWFREDFAGLGTLLRDTLDSPDPWPGLPVQPDRAVVRRLLDEHLTGRRNHPQRLYTLLVQSLWARTLRG